MFIQPDWFDVMQPGVGTNRFSYSFNDPINLADPSGNATVYKDMDGDGWSEYYGTISYGEPGFDDDFSESGIQPSEWVDFNNASKGGGSQSVQAGMNIAKGIHDALVKPLTVNDFRLNNPGFINGHELLAKITSDPKFYTFALGMLVTANYLDFARVRTC